MRRFSSFFTAFFAFVILVPLLPVPQAFAQNVNLVGALTVVAGSANVSYILRDGGGMASLDVTATSFTIVTAADNTVTITQFDGKSIDNNAGLVIECFGTETRAIVLQNKNVTITPTNTQTCGIGGTGPSSSGGGGGGGGGGGSVSSSPTVSIYGAPLAPSPSSTTTTTTTKPAVTPVAETPAITPVTKQELADIRKEVKELSAVELKKEIVALKKSAKDEEKALKQDYNKQVAEAKKTKKSSKERAQALKDLRNVYNKNLKAVRTNSKSILNELNKSLKQKQKKAA